MNRRRALRQLAQLLQRQVPSRPDWTAVLWLAGEQLLVPQLYAPLASIRRRVPDEVWTYVAEARRRTRARNARLCETLGDALAALNASGIEPILLKGCALWAEAPGPLESDRLISDLDLLVRPEEMQLAIDALAGAGFLLLEDDRATSAHDVVVLGRSSDVGAIDLHQHAPAAWLAEGMDHLHDHARRVCFPRGVAKAPSPELQILVAAMHDQLHDAHFWRGGFNLRHLLDIAAIAKGSVDWRRVAAMCRTPTTRTALAAELQAARRIAGADIPDGVLAGAWGAFHFWRQRAQFAFPWIGLVLDRVRGVRGLGAAQHRLWSWLLQRTSGHIGANLGEPAA